MDTHTNKSKITIEVKSKTKFLFKLLQRKSSFMFCLLQVQNVFYVGIIFNRHLQSALKTTSPKPQSSKNLVRASINCIKFA